MPLEPLSELTLFRPVFMILLAAVVINSIYVLFLQKRIRASYFIIFNSFLMLIAAIALANQQLVILNELNFLEDRAGTVSILLIALLMVLSLLAYLPKSLNKKTGDPS